jgi:hypothetical protein
LLLQILLAMKKNRLIFYSIFGAYHLVVFFFTMYVKTKDQDPISLIPLLSHMTIFLYGTVLGIILLVVDFIWSLRVDKKTALNEEEMRLENNTLKARIYDLQEGSKTAFQTPPAIK